MLTYQAYDWHFLDVRGDDHIYDMLHTPKFIRSHEERYFQGYTIEGTGSIGELWGLVRLEGKNAFYRRIEVLPYENT